MGKVLKVQLNIKKGEPPVPVESCEAVAGSGIRGDRHVGKGERDVCLCRKELLDWMGEQKVKGLCFARHRADSWPERKRCWKSLIFPNTVFRRNVSWRKPGLSVSFGRNTRWPGF